MENLSPSRTNRICGKGPAVYLDEGRCMAVQALELRLEDRARAEAAPVRHGQLEDLPAQRLGMLGQQGTQCLGHQMQLVHICLPREEWKPCQHLVHQAACDICMISFA